MKSNLEAESALVSALLANNDLVDEVVSTVSKHHFQHIGIGSIFDAVVTLRGRNQPADTVTVTSFLQQAGLLEAINIGSKSGSDAIRDIGLASSRKNSEAALAYASIIRTAWTQRQLTALGSDIQSRAHETSPNELIDQAAAELEKLSLASSSDTLVTIEGAFDLSLEAMEEAASRGLGIGGMSTTLTDLDAITGGLRGGDMVIVAGRPGLGKSGLGFQMLAGAAKRGDGALGFSLEMPSRQVAMRLACAETKLNYSVAQDGQLSAPDKQLLYTAKQKMKTWPAFIDDKANITIPELRAKVRKIGRQLANSSNKLRLVVVDYLQLMRGPAEAGNREQEVSEISRSLKVIAKEFDVCMVVLSQLNRKCEERPDKRPMISDLRESGAIEQDADMVWFVFRQEMYAGCPENLKGIAEIIVGKNRNGPQDTCHVGFVGLNTSFHNLSDERRMKAGLPKKS